MTKSQAPRPRCPGDLQHLNKKKTQQRGAKLLIVMSFGHLTLDQKNAPWRRAKLFVVMALRTCSTWTKKKHNNKELSSSLSCPWLATFEQKNVQQWGAQLNFVMTLKLATLEQNSACLNLKKKHRKEEGSLPCSSIVFHACFKLLPPGHSKPSPCFSSLFWSSTTLNPGPTKFQVLVMEESTSTKEGWAEWGR
jgi:hypothetical protein